MNSVYDWPFDATHGLGAAHIDVLDIHGQPHAEQCDPGVYPVALTEPDALPLLMHCHCQVSTLHTSSIMDAMLVKKLFSTSSTSTSCMDRLMVLSRLLRSNAIVMHRRLLHCDPEHSETS